MKRFKLLLTVATLLSAVLASAQNITVKGVVTDASTGEGLPAASVIVRGTLQGVQSDMMGNYSVSVPSNGVLVFSTVGYKTVEVAVSGKTTINVTLELDMEFLDDVVVTAQGLTRKEKSIGYATQQVDGEKLSVARQTDLGNAMAGKIAGARFYGRSGATFDSGSIILRGTSDFRYPEGAEPIYVIDGAIGNKDSVNMDDVESINVLKGAAATALYGSQGGNGAVIITTKRAKASDKGRIEVSHTLTFDKYYNHFNMQKEYGGGSYGYDGAILGNNDAYANYDTMSPQFLYGMYEEWQNTDGSFYYDFDSDESWGARFDPNVMMANANYFDPTSSQYMKAKPYVHQLDLGDLYRTGLSNTTNVAFSKAGNDYTIRVSYTNNTRRGLQPNSDAERHFLGIKTTYKPKEWLNISMDYKYTYRKNHNGATEGYNATGNVYHEYLQWGQTSVDLKDFKDYKRPDGSWRTWNPISINNMSANFHDNPYATFDSINYYDTYNWNVFTGDAEALLPFNLKAGFKVIGNMRSFHRERKRSEGSINYTSYYYEDQNHVSNLTLQGRLTWGDRFIDDRLSIDAAAFIEQLNYDYGDLYASTSDGLIIDGFYNLSSSNGYVSASNSQTHYKTRSVFGTVTAGFDDTFFLDASLRNDWDSRLPLTHNSYLYGGLSASIMLNQFLKESAPWLNYWKLRGSLAQVGSTLGTYATNPTYTCTTANKYNALATMYRSTVQLNPDIQPTLSTSYEVGTEFRMFNSRLWGDINLYTIDTRNQILNMTVAPQSGYSSRQLNTGLVRNQGIEISLGGTPVKTKDFEWDIDMNIAKNVNTLVSLNDNIKTYMLEGNSFYYYWYLKSNEGEPMGSITTMARWARDEQGRLIFQPSTSSAWGGGYAPVYDLNNEKTVGNFQPDWTGGFSTSFRYKNLQVAANFDFMIGGQMVSWTNMWGTGSGLSSATSKLNKNGVNEREPIAKGGGVYVEGVDKEGKPVQAYFNAYQFYHYQAYYDLDYWVYDRTYLKMRELSVSYNFPKALLQKANVGLSTASLSFVAGNPWLIYSAVPNVDPSEAGSNWLEGGQTASVRSFGFTLKLGF